ncbi:MAG: hypothetical protein AAF927_04675 [Bacteroidota bacterium]
MSFDFKNRRRALRRHHRDRLKQKRKHYWGGDLAENSKSHLLINTPKPCSCFMCGNPRKFAKAPSLQEQKSELELRQYFA